MRTTLGLTGCSSDAATSNAATGSAATGNAATGSASIAPQELRNDAAQELAAARQATLVPVGTQVDLLQRAELRARLAGQPASAELTTTITTYQQLAVAIEAAPTPSAVHALVEQAGIDLSTGAPEPLN